jgi:hypothetical protein
VVLKFGIRSYILLFQTVVFESFWSQFEKDMKENRNIKRNKKREGQPNWANPGSQQGCSPAALSLYSFFSFYLFPR